MPNLSVITSCDYISKAEIDVFFRLPMAEFSSSAVEKSCSVFLLSKDAAVTTLALYYLNKNCSLDAQPIW